MNAPLLIKRIQRCGDGVTQSAEQTAVSLCGPLEALTNNKSI